MVDRRHHRIYPARRGRGTGLLMLAEAPSNTRIVP